MFSEGGAQAAPMSMQWPQAAAPVFEHSVDQQGATALYHLGGGLQLLAAGPAAGAASHGLPLQLQMHELRQHLLQQHQQHQPAPLPASESSPWLLDSDGLSALAAAAHLQQHASSSFASLQHTGGLSSLSNASALTTAAAATANNNNNNNNQSSSMTVAAAAAGDIMVSSGSLSALMSTTPGPAAGADLAQQQGGAPAAAGGVGSASLYVKNLHADADELYLYQKFAPHGALLSCKVKTDPTTGKCRGVGFVNFVDQACALRAMQQLHGSRTSEGRQLHITLQAPRAVRAAAAAAAAAAACPLPLAHHPAGAALLLHDHPYTHAAAAAGRAPSALPAGVFTSPYAPSPPVQQTTVFSHQAPSVANARLHLS